MKLKNLLKWCDENFYEPYKMTRFEKSFRAAAERFGIVPKTVKTPGGKDARGYIGASVKLDPGTKLFED